MNGVNGVTQITWSPGVSLENLIQQVVETAMVFYRGNKTATAQSLGISIRTLDNRLEKYAKEKTEHEQRIATAKDERADFIARQRAIPAAGRFDNTATPSPHDAAVKARYEEQRPAHGGGTASGVHPESAQDVSAQRSMSVPKRA